MQRQKAVPWDGYTLPTIGSWKMAMPQNGDYTVSVTVCGIPSADGDHCNNLV